MKMKVYDRVKIILEQIPATRDSDSLLIWEYAKQADLLTLNNKLLTFNSFNKIRFETIRRSRQKIQQYHEHLRPSKRIASSRKNIEESKGMFVYNEVENLS